MSSPQRRHRFSEVGSHPSALANVTRSVRPTKDLAEQRFGWVRPFTPTKGQENLPSLVPQRLVARVLEVGHDDDRPGPPVNRPAAKYPVACAAISEHHETPVICRERRSLGAVFCRFRRVEQGAQSCVDNKGSRLG